MRVQPQDPEYIKDAAAETAFWQDAPEHSLEAQDEQLAESPVDRYINRFQHDSYTASAFPRRKDNLSLRLGSYWRHQIEMELLPSSMATVSTACFTFFPGLPRRSPV